MTSKMRARDVFRWAFVQADTYLQEKKKSHTPTTLEETEPLSLTGLPLISLQCVGLPQWFGSF